MRRLELLLFLLLATVAVAQNDFARGDIAASGLQRDTDGVTTVLLVPAPLGKPAPPVGVLTKTARTFVQDGASTEYATQVVGTTLDNGRLYAKILSTSSRVFYDKDTPADPAAVDSPFLVYPSVTSQDNTKLVLDNVPLKIVETIASKTSSSNDPQQQEESTTPREDDNDILSAEVVGFKPAKVRSDNLPTYTVKQDYVVKGQDAGAPAVLEDEQPKSFQPRTPKSFRPAPKVAPKKEIKPLATVTYHGFADFVTTVGDTVIVFSPSTAPAPVGRPATTIKGDATLRPDDGVAVLKIKPTAVLPPAPKKTETLASRPRLPVNKFSHKNLKSSSSSSSIHDLEPSSVAHPEAESSGVHTSPLLLIPSEKSATGLIKVIDSTTANKGTTTHYMSSVYGTYINNNYAQIVHTSSNVFFFPEDSTKSYEDENESNDVPADTTESVITTEATTESELGNDIIPLNQGRSIKGLSPKNIFPGLKGQRNKNKEEKVSLATRLLPSTIYKTFTYFTTFFIPGKGRTSTSIKSREVVSSEVTYLTELILPSSTQSASITPTKSPTSMMNKVAVSSNTDIIDSEKQEVEEIQLIFKTIFTTFTYLTTFYDDSTTSVSSRKVTATNVITQTVDPISASIDVDRFIEKDASVSIKPTKIAVVGSTHLKTKAVESKGLYKNRFTTTTEETTESITTTEPEQLTTIEHQTTPETTTEKPKAKVDPVIALEPSPTPSATAELVSEQLKTYYTTYTYFTTVFVDDETEVETRTEIFSNVVTETIKPTSVLPAPVEKTAAVTTPKSAPPPEILAYLEALKKQKSSQEALLLAKKVQERTHVTTEETIETTTDDPSFTTYMDETTTADDITTTEKMSNDDEVQGSTKTDVIFTSSSGGSTLLEDKKSNDPEDQELSETNHHDVEPAPTLLLQTSYTTYTYFTTMYNGDNTDVVSRLKTVTNVVTETIKPTAVVQLEPKTAQPLTYFTTFTYWTTFIKGDETATTSREETVSNVVTPGVADTSSVQLEVVKTYRPFILATPVHSSSVEPSRESKATSDNEITTSPKVIIKEIPTIKFNELSSTVSPDPVTLYTTYTYFTTSYIGNSTVLSSRLETVTSVSYPDDLLVKATPRAIGGGAPSQILNTDEKSTITPSQVSEAPKTGLLSTVRSSKVNDGTTTHYMTDVYGTYIDGLYAQVIETSSKIELPTPVYSSSATPVLPTGVLYLNKGSIVDADELTTVYFTTKQIGTSLNGLYAKVIESTSTTKIDNKKLETFTPVKGHRTGLVRLIKGHIDANDTTTYYQSKVIGTSIDGRYAQIIESTSSYLVKPTAVHGISPSSTVPPNHATAIPDIAPSPAVIQSSISEDHTETNDEDHENENEDESDDKLKKKSRLTFSTRKRPSSAPPIRPFISRSRPTFNPKRKPQGATTITRSDFTPTITATLAGTKGNRFASSRGRATPSLGSSPINPSSSRRFSGGRRSSIPATSSANYIAQSSRSRGGVRATSAYSVRRSSTPLRGSSARPISRSSAIPISSTRYKPGIRPSSTILRPSSTIKHEDQEDNANEFATATLATEETPVVLEEAEHETDAPLVQTTTESPRRANNPLLRFKRPPGFGSGVRTTTPRPTITTTSRRANSARQLNRGNINRARPTVSTTKGRQSQSSLFPPRAPYGKKPESTEAPVENKTDNPEETEENIEDAPVEEINDNDYEGSEQKEAAPPTTERAIPQPSIRPFTRGGRGRRVRRQISLSRQTSSRFRRPTSQTPAPEERAEVDTNSDEYSKPTTNSRGYGSRGRSLSTNPRASYNNKEDKSSEDYYDSVPQIRSRSKPVTSRTPLRVKPSPVSSSKRQFTLRDKESPLKSTYKRPGITTPRSTNIRSRNNLRSRTGTNRYQDLTNSRRTPSRTTSRNGSRNSNRRITPSRNRLNSYEDYRDVNDFDGTITVTHYVPTEVTIPVVNNGVTEKRNIITAHPSTEVVGPDRYSTITNSDGRNIVVLGSETTGTNFQGLLEVTKFIIHETPTTKVSHTLTSAGGRKFSQAVVVPTTVYSVENVVSTIRPSIPDNSPLANILLSQLLLGQLGQQNPLATALPSAQSATPTTRYDTRATTYVTTLTKHRSTVIPLTFRGKEILTTLVDTSSDVVTATEFITDTVVVTPTVALPQANLNSLLLLLQQPQVPLQPNPLLDPLLAAAPLTQSNTLPGEVETRNQPVDFDYKPDSYEDLSDEDTGDKPARVKANIPKTNDKEAAAAVESSVITLYVSGRRPGEFSTVLSTVKVGDESRSTKIKRNVVNEAVISASLSPTSLLSEASEPVEYVLAGSEEPFDAHAPTQSLESVVGDVGRHISTSIYTCAYYRDTSALTEDAQAFGDRSPESEYYDTDEDDYPSRKRVRVRVPVIRSRTAKEHALTVVRRRPLVPYTKSLSYQQIEPSLSSPTPRRIVVTRTKVRNYDSIDANYHLGDEISNDLSSKSNRHKVTVTRRRKVRPSSTTVAPSQRDRVTRVTRVTRKKLVTVRPIPEPSSTLAIITTGFYTAPSFEVEEEEEEPFDYDYSQVSTPVLHGSYITRNDPIPSFTPVTTKLISSSSRSSTASDPIIITDNFFFPSAPEAPSSGNTNSYYEYDNAKTDTTEKSEDENLEQETTSETPNVTEPILTTSDDVESTTLAEEEETTEPVHDNEDDLKVIPIMSDQKIESTPTISEIDSSLTSSAINESEIPTVIPLITDLLSSSKIKTEVTPASMLKVTTSSSPSLTTEDIEAGLTDDLYLSLSRPDFPQIVPSKVENEESTILPSSTSSQSSQATPELQTSVYYTETVVTSTRLRTYTYVVTKLNGQETEVTSSTSVRPRVTTLTLTVPVTVTVTPTLISSSVALNSSFAHQKNEEVEDEGRRFNHLATRVMSNGVEVIVAGTTPAYRWENSNPQPTLTLSEAVLMLMPQDKPNDFVTKTCTTTFTYLNTILRDGTTIVSTDQQVIANTATEERHRKRPAEAASVTLEASPTLQTEVFKTTYTYLTLNSDHPDEKNALGSSTKVITNIVTAPQYYLEMVLEPSEAPRPETNTYYSTRALEKTYVEEGKTKIEMTTYVVTQLIITESSVPPPRATSLTTPSLPVADESISSTTDIAKTYYITYTYFNTYLENDSTVVKTNIATSSDIVYEKASSKKSSTKSVAVSATPEPIQIFATKTYLTTFTYFTTLLQAGLDGETSTTISSRTKIVENVVTESIAPSLLDAGYMNALLTTSHHSDTLKNVVTGSTIIFFDDEEQVTPTSAAFDTSASATIDKIDTAENTSAPPAPAAADSAGAESNDATTRPVEQENNYNEEEAAEETTDPPPSKKPSQVSNLLSLGSLGINSLSALGPVITAMAGLLQGKSSATRRNDTEPVTELPTTTTQRSPIYIPVGEFADGDIETAESQNIAHQLANSNHLTETRHKVAASLDGGIAISPGEIITANSDVIIGKPGKMAPRPPQTFLNEENIGMKPPPVPVPNIPVHPVLEVVEREPVKPVKIQKGSQQLEIYPAHQIYEEHIKLPITYDQPNFSKRPQNVHENIHVPPSDRISSKKDILENDPLLIPPSLLSNAEKHRPVDKYRRPWSAKDPIPQANVLVGDKNRLGYPPIDLGNGIATKEHGPEPIVHQVPHVIDRSTGQPLLVNIQPSQVANVVIPQGGTQALIFGDTPEPHKSGQYFDDPSPYPEPEVGPGFIGIDKVENLPQFSKNDNPSDYMTPPSPPSNLKPVQNPNSSNRPHAIPLSTNQDHKRYGQASARPEHVPIRHHDTSSLSSGGQGHVHTEILVHHGGGESAQTRPQSSVARPSIPAHNYQNIQFPPRKDYTKIHIPAEQQMPPRRTEVPSENSYYDQQQPPSHANVNWSSNKSEKKPLRPSQVRWSRPTSRPSRPPIKITGRPYGRPPTRLDRPSGSVRPPQFTQRLPTTTYYQNEQHKFNQQPPTSIPFGESNQQMYTPGQVKPQDNKPHHYFQDNYAMGINLHVTTNRTVQDYKGDSFADQINLGLGYKNPTFGEIDSDSKIIGKPIDSDVEASEDIKISTGPNDKPEDDIIIAADSDKNKFETTITFDQDRVGENGDGEIIMGSEKKQDQYLSQSPYGGFDHNDHHSVYVTDTGPQQNITTQPQFIDLQPPAINPLIEPNGHSRPFSKPHFSMTSSDNKPDVITESPNKNDEIVHGHIKPGLGQVLHVQNDKGEYQTRKNESRIHIYRRPKPDFPPRIHADRPEIITKPKLKTPRPVIISSGKIRKQSSYRKPQVHRFSLPIDSTGEENDSKTQTERPPSSDTTNYNKKPMQESLDTAFQTNFATDDHKDETSNDRIEQNASFPDIQKISNSKSKLLSQDMVPPPVTPAVNKEILNNDEGLKPPPPPTVLGLTPPPVDITTTTRPIENKPKVNAEVSGMKPPPLYIPLQESSTPVQPSVDMVPPSPRPSVVRPFLADVLSQDMVPPPPDVKTTRPLEIATVRPGVAVSGSIQIGTAVATSHIPVVQDMESKIPIVHGTVDLPVVVDVPEFLKPIDNKKPDHVSVYTVRPFETRQRNSAPPTMSPSKTTSVAATKHTQVKNNERVNEDVYVPTRLSPSYISKKQPTKHHHHQQQQQQQQQSEFVINLEPSSDIHMPSSRIEATETLNIAKRTKQRSSVTEVVRKAPVVVVESPQVSKNVQQRSSSQGVQATRKTDLKIKQSASKMMEIIGTVVHEFIQNSTNEQVETQPHEVTRFETLTVTRTETSVLGSPPTTRTLLITHTLTSTRVETVTETLLRPTSVISTIISTVLQSATHVPTYENDNNDNESIFVVMSDHTPPAAGAEEVEAEYGEEDISRDEEDNSVNEIHRVLQGGILGAPSVPIRPPKIQCVPECKAFKSEVCAESATGETRCVCRPGFARMFPDRPCKPTYTFTLGVGLERLGRDRFVYDRAMNDTNSVAFRRYAHPIKEALDRTLMQSDLRDAYRDVNIVKFTPKPPKVMFNVQLSSNTDETRLKDVLKKFLIMSNYSLGGTEVYASKDLGLIEAKDFDECTNEEGGPHHDCSVNAACFNLKGTYQCSCKEGFADLSENPAYPGRLCSQAPLGCAACNNKGHCLINTHGQELCECFPWYSGQKCQVNLKVLLIALVTTGAILLGLLAVCLGMACFRNPVRRRSAGDRRAMIAAGGGDTSSEGSVAELALPHHVPHILPPPPQMIAPQPPLKKVAKKVSAKTRRAPRKPAPLIAPVASNASCLPSEQRDRSMTVMIPRAKYRSAPQQSGPLPQNYKPMSSFAVDEHKLIDYLESGAVSAHRKPSLVAEPDYKDQSPIKMQPAQQSSFATNGALVSAGFQVSATVTRAMDAESTLGRSCTETTLEPATKLVRVSDFCDDLESTMVRSCAETTIQASTKQLLRLELADAGSTLARSCGETTIQPPTKLADRNSKDRDLARDSASEGHTMAERDLGSTLRLPAQHATLYNQDRTTSSDRESNFDSL